MDNAAKSISSYEAPRIEERSPLGTPLIGLNQSGPPDQSAAFHAI